MVRGAVWWAALPDPSGSIPGFRRPVLIIQADYFTQSEINTVVAVALSSNLRLANAPGNVFLPADKTGLPKDSVANVSQIITLDKRFFIDKITELSHKQMQSVEAGLRLLLSL